MMPTRRRAEMGGSPPPDRAAGLDLDLGPVPVPAQPVIPPLAAVTEAPVVEPQPEAPAAKRRPAKRKAKEETPARPISGRIPGSLFVQVNEASPRRRETHEAWFLREFDAVWDKLPEVYGPPVESRRVPQRRPLRRSPGDEPLAQYTLRLTTEEAQPLHEQFEELRPPSMADLMTTIVRLGLEHDAR